MAHHAYVVEGNSEEVMHKARSFAARELSLTGSDNPDIREFMFGLFSVDDAKRIADAAYQSATGDQKLVVICAARLFHESQNALLKVFEEPPQGVTIILGVPTLGILLPTLRSRLLPLPTEGKARGNTASSAEMAGAIAFLGSTTAEREKYIAKLVDRAKSDNESKKQEARTEALELLQSLMHYFYQKLHEVEYAKNTKEIQAFLSDLDAFVPLMHERSVPLKLIFEHILLVIPTLPDIHEV